MKMITAMIQPFMVTKVTDSLEEIEGFPGITISEARGFGRHKNRNSENTVTYSDYREKIRLEIVAPDEMVDEIIKTIEKRAHTGKQGDGKIFVWEVEQAVRIRTGESGIQAI
jgi:nitrogen regulatory protein PII